MEQEELDDLFQLSRAAQNAIVSIAVIAAPTREQDELAWRGEVSDLLALAAAPEEQLLAHRSAEATAHARRALAKKHATRSQEIVSAKRHVLEARISALVVHDPCNAAILGVKRRRGMTQHPMAAAQLLVRIATSPHIRAVEFRSHRKLQVKSLALLSQCLVRLTKKCWDSLLCGALLAADASTHAATSASTLAATRKPVIMFACQWDETSQKFRPLSSCGSSGWTTRQALAHQTMVFLGYMVQLRASEATIRSEPCFACTLTVKETSANFLLEGLLPCLPFEVADMGEFARSSEAFIFSITVDRASANLLSAAWLAQQIAMCPSRVLPWAEFCCAHGVALVKKRAHELKELSTSMTSLTHCLKYRRNVEALQQQIADLVADSFEVRFGEPDDEFTERGRTLLNVLFGGDHNDALWRWDKKRSTYVPTELKTDLEKFCEIAALRSDGPRWVHFCRVRSGSAEATQGKRVGDRCCASRQESLQKVVDCVLKLAVGRAWRISCASRWTHVTSVLRRFCLLSANGNLLPQVGATAHIASL